MAEAIAPVLLIPNFLMRIDLLFDD